MALAGQDIVDVNVGLVIVGPVGIHVEEALYICQTSGADCTDLEALADKCLLEELPPEECVVER